MYLSAERLALANQEIQETFEQTCVAWQAIPHWDTGDPGQTFVRNDFMTAAATPGSVEPPIGGETLAITAEVVRFYDERWPKRLRPRPMRCRSCDNADRPSCSCCRQRCRRQARRQGSRCGIRQEQDCGRNPRRAHRRSDGRGERRVSRTVVSVLGQAGFQGTQRIDRAEFLSTEYAVRRVPNINSLHRFQKLDQSGAAAKARLMLLLGRRQRIAHGGAATASAGEEPVDLAVSVPPSLEVVGETVAAISSSPFVSASRSGSKMHGGVVAVTVS